MNSQNISTGQIPRRAGNLRPFKKGQSGNPGGRPAGASITALVRAELQKPSAEDPTITNGEMLAKTVTNLALAGDKVMAPLVWRYMDGDPKAAAEMSLRELAEHLAERLGLDAGELLADFERDQGAG